jgi:hypothetical protein
MRRKILEFRVILITGSLVATAPIGATTVFYGTLTEATDYRFDTFGNNANETTRGANLGGSASATWYDINMSTNPTGADNGISWTGLDTDTVGAAGVYGYTGIYSGNPGTASSADSLTNTGIHGANVAVNITATVGHTYAIDLLFANGFNTRTFDVTVGNTLYLKNLRLEMGSTRPEVYRFEYVAVSDQIQITFSGGEAFDIYQDTNPYVNAVMVTQTAIPELSSSVLIVIGLMGFVLRRRRA